MADTTAKVMLLCDESGAKGYTDQPEQFDGQVGVFAGIFLPGELYDEKLRPFEEIAHRYAASLDTHASSLN